MRIEWTHEQRDRAIMMRESGISYRLIGREFGVSRSCITEFIKGKDRRRNRKPRSPSLPRRMELPPNCPIRGVTRVAAVTSHCFMLPDGALRSRIRSRRIAQSRQVAMYLSRVLTDASLTRIGNYFGRDHTTVHHAFRAVEARIASNEVFAAKIGELQTLIRDCDSLPKPVEWLVMECREAA